jgi:hypothetical protein
MAAPSREAGELTLTLDRGEGLNDKYAVSTAILLWSDSSSFRSPYCVITCGAQRFQSRTSSSE